MSPLDVREAHEGDVLRAGVVLLAPAGRHLTFRRRRGRRGGRAPGRETLRDCRTARRWTCSSSRRPRSTGRGCSGVVMTGMGSDGKQGAAWIKAQGGLVYTESEETCVVYGMPSSVVEAGLSDRSVPLDRMAQAIREAV